MVQTPTGEVLFESAVINEYLDEAHGPQMMPDTPLARAYERMWCDFVGGIYGPAYRINMAKDEATARESVAAAKAKFAQLEEEVGFIPPAILEGDAYPETFGELVEAYEQ